MPHVFKSKNFNRERDKRHSMESPAPRTIRTALASPVDVSEASFEEELVTNMTYADQMHEARFGGLRHLKKNMINVFFLGDVLMGR